MSNAVVGALRVSLGLDTAAFENGLTGAQKRLKGLSGRLKSIDSAMVKTGAVMATALAAGATAAAAALNQVTGNLVEMGAAAKTAGVSFEAFQTLKYVAEQAHVGIDALTDGLKEMQLRADEFAVTGKGSAAEAFARIGYSASAAKEALKDPAAMFDDIVARMQKLDKAAQIRVADEIFGGTGGEQFVRLLDLGADGIAKLKSEFVANGGLIPEEQLKKAEAFQASIGKVKAAFSGIAINALMDSGLVEWFTDVTPKVIAFGQTIAKEWGPKLTPIFEGLSSAVQAVGELFHAVFGTQVGSAGGAVITFGDVVKRVLDGALKFIGGAFTVIGDLVRAVAALFRGDLSGAWSHLVASLRNTVGTLLNVFRALAPETVAAVQRMVQGVTDWLVGKLFGVLKGVIDRVKLVSDAFFKLYDAVVGNSYVPDMVTEVGQWMARLDDNLVKPAERATTKAAEAFEALRDRVARVMEGLMTDREKLDLGFRSDSKALDEGLAGKVITPAEHQQAMARLRQQYETARAGSDAEGLTMGSLGDFSESFPKLESVQQIWQGVQQGIEDTRQAFDESAQRFGDAFASNIERALQGDIKGVFNDMLSSVLRSALSSLGESLFRGGSTGGWGGIVSAFTGWFTGLPGFANGGSFQVGGSGQVDSKLVAFRATPGERVDISTPRQQRQQGGAYVIDVVPTPYFDAQVRKVSAPGSVQAGVASFRAGEAQRERATRIAPYKRGSW